MAYVQLPNQNRLSGINTLAYMGTEANTPPQFVIEKRDPTQNDYQGWLLGTLWLYKGTNRVWMLVDKQANVATWVRVYPSAEQFLTDNGTATPVNGILNVLGGVNMRTEALSPAADTVTVNVTDHPVLAGGLTITPLAAPGVVTTDAAGTFNSTNGTDQQIIIARAAGPVWANLTSIGGSVVISDNGNNINLEAAGGGGGGGTGGLAADIGGAALPAVAAPHYINVLGNDVIKTTVTAPNTLTIDIEDSPNNGDLIIGGGAGVASTWGSITSTGMSVTITHPAPNTINLEVAGGAGGFGGLKDDAGAIATPDVSHCVQVKGDGLITTLTAGSTLTASLNYPSAKGKVLISSSVGAPVWANIVGAGGITVTNSDGGITLTGGGAGGGGIITLDCDSGVATDPGTHVVKLEGRTSVGVAPTAAYENIITYGSGSTAQIALTSTIQLPLTNTGGTQGVIKIGTNDFMHSYGTANTFLGETAGNRTFNVATSQRNTGIGQDALTAIAYGANNTACGSDSLQALVGTNVSNMSYNTALGAFSGSLLATGNYNLFLGYSAGSTTQIGSSNIYLMSTSASATANHEIRIGTNGSGNGQQNRTHIAGVYDSVVGVGDTASVVVCTSSSAGLAVDRNRLMTVSGGTVGKVLRSNGSYPTWSRGAAGILFNAYPQDTTNVTGDSTQYYLGSELGLPIVITKNIGGGSTFVGSAGNKAWYEVPEDGSYLMSMQIRFNGLKAPVIAPPPVPPATKIDPMVIEISRGGIVIKEWAHYPILKYDGYTSYASAFFEVIYPMVAGDRISWYLQCDYRPGYIANPATPWVITYPASNASKCIGIDTISGDLQFSQLSVVILTDV